MNNWRQARVEYHAVTRTLQRYAGIDGKLWVRQN